MDHNKWTQIKKVFNDAAELPPDQQSDFVQSTFPDDYHAQRVVFDMLKQVQGSAPVAPINLSRIVSDQAADMLSHSNVIAIGDLIDGFRVLSLIGEGGMGSVFLAERQDQDYLQTVAIKVVHKQKLSEENVQRFRRERQILASLNHRNIASFIGGGTTDEGQPYIILEYVNGANIVDYCRQHNLSVTERLQLFKQVLAAVSFAHQHLVIHRDIKPSNVLVTDDGDVKLLDFGIAKLLEPDSTNLQPDLTQQQTRLLTPGNASPEQVVGNDITTRSDIYGLGTLLMHLMTEHPLFETEGISSREIENRILQDTPLKPSKKCAQSSDLNVRQRASQLQGDLDTIVMTALQKDPQRRYATVEQFADDIRSFQYNYPISAKPDKFTYRLSKFVKRNTASTVIGCGALLSLIAFLLVLYHQRQQIQYERDNALNEANVARQTAALMADMFNAADPNIHSGSEITANQLVASAAAKVESLTVSPPIRAKLLLTIGNVYLSLGSLEQAQVMLKQANELTPGFNSSTEPDQFINRIDIELALAKLGNATGEYAEVQQRMLHVLNELNSAQRPELSYQTENNFGYHIHSELSAGFSNSGDDEQALNHARKALDIALAGQFSASETSLAYSVFAHSLRRTGEFEQASDALQHAIRLIENYGDGLDLAYALNQLASTYLRLERYSEALDAAEQGLAMRQRIYERPHAEILASMGNVANALVQLNQLPAAIELRTQQVEQVTELFGKQHLYYAATSQALAELLLQSGQLERAQQIFNNSLRAHQEVFPAGHYNLARPLVGLGRIAMEEQDFTSALDYFQQAWTMVEQHLSRDHEVKAKAAAYYSVVLRLAGEQAKAEELANIALSMQAALFGLQSEHYQRIVAILNPEQAN